VCALASPKIVAGIARDPCGGCLSQAKRECKRNVLDKAESQDSFPLSDHLREIVGIQGY